MKRVGYTQQPNAFKLLDGTNVGDTCNNFADGEPDNNQCDEGFEVFYTNTGLWKSELCTTDRHFVCQKVKQN